MKRVNIAAAYKSYYETDDFKGNHWDCLLEDTSYCIERIKRIVKIERNLTITFDQAWEILDYMRNNMSEFIREFTNYRVGLTCVDSRAFGEQCEQLTGITNPDTNKPYNKAYLIRAFENEGYIVHKGYAYYDLSHKGIYIEFLAGDLNELFKKFES